MHQKTRDLREGYRNGDWCIYGRHDARGDTLALRLIVNAVPRRWLFHRAISGANCSLAYVRHQSALRGFSATLRLFSARPRAITARPRTFSCDASSRADRWAHASLGTFLFARGADAKIFGSACRYAAGDNPPDLPRRASTSFAGETPHHRPLRRSSLAGETPHMCR